MAGQKIDLSKIHAALDRIPAEFTGKVAKVGWFESNKYDDGNNTPVAYVAAIQEFGDGKIPPRPFMRTTFAEKSSEWVDEGVKLLRNVIRNGASGDDVLENLGRLAKGDIYHKISQITEPPLSEYTVQRRLAKLENKKITSTLRKPLVDSGIMQDTIEVRVE